MGARSGRRERPSGTGPGPQVVRTLPPSQPQHRGGTTETENSDELPRYTGSVDGHKNMYDGEESVYHHAELEVAKNDSPVVNAAGTQNSSTDGER